MDKNLKLHFCGCMEHGRWFICTVRSLGSVALRMTEFIDGGRHHFNFFALDLNEVI